MSIIIPRSLSRHVLMVGVYYKHNAPGGMAAVVQYYARYMEGLRYVVSWRLGNALVRVGYALTAWLRVLLTLLFDRRVKIVHLHTAADGSFWRKSSYMRLAKAMGRKVVLHMHASRFKDFYNESSRKEAIVANLRKADRLIVLSQSWREWFKGIGVDASRIIVLPNITDFPAEGAGRTEDGKLHLLFLGVIGPRKGVFDLLAALVQHKDEWAGKVVLRIGGNLHEQELLATIRDNGLQDMVTFEGWVAGEHKQELLRWADIYVLPSYNEGLPIGILEAMSYGCPIISTPVGGIPEVVEIGRNGVLVTPGDIDAIGQAIDKYIAQPALVRTEGEESRQRVSGYLPDAVMQQLSDIYTSLLPHPAKA